MFWWASPHVPSLRDSASIAVAFPALTCGASLYRRCATKFTMQADYAVELGREDETLEVPWESADGGLRYVDLKREPERIREIEEANGLPELRDFLGLINSARSNLQSAKCDTWASTEIHAEEEIFEAPWKFGSYIDLFCTESSSQVSFPAHEEFLKKIVDLLKRAPDLPASAEFLLRRCYFHEKGDVRDGLYVTFYLFGFGQDENKARRQWAIAMKLARNAFAQLNSCTSAL